MMTSNNLTVISYNSESNKHCNMLHIFVMIKISKYLLRGALTLNYMGVLIASPCRSYFQRLQDQTSYLLLYLLGLKDSIGFVANRCYVPPWITGEPYIQKTEYFSSVCPAGHPSVHLLPTFIKNLTFSPKQTCKQPYIHQKDFKDHHYHQDNSNTTMTTPPPLPPPPHYHYHHHYHDSSTSTTMTTKSPSPPPSPPPWQLNHHFQFRGALKELLRTFWLVSNFRVAINIDIKTSKL